MDQRNCSNVNDLDSKFSEPMPWIGTYIGAASLACSFAMTADTLYGLYRRKFWFPCKFFSFNATSLALLAIAVKLPMDLNSPMTGREEQLTKLSSSIFFCIAMGNSMPSLGAMKNNEIYTNMTALGILVITLIVNVCIQMGTGVIYAFQPEHAIIMFFMLVLLVILGFSALTVPITKQLLEQQYNSNYQKPASGRYAVEKLTEDLTKCWMMAHTSSPQNVMGRSVTCTASGAICLLSSLILVETLFRSYLLGYLNSCLKSDYGWSIPLVLLSQIIAIGVSIISPACRWFNAINFRCHRKNWIHKNEFKVERFWVQRFVEWKENPLALGIHSPHRRKFVHDTKNLLMDICIQMQIVVVLLSKSGRLVSILFVSMVKKFLECCCCWCCCCCYCCNCCCNCYCCKGLMGKFKASESSNNNEPESQSSKKPDLSEFVLHLEGEENMVEFIRKSTYEATNHWIERGRKKQPKDLIQLLKKSTMSLGFRGVAEFDSDQVDPLISSEKPPNCWALSVVTLTSIAIALPNSDHNAIKQLLHGVSEGLRYVRLIETDLDTNGSLINIRRAADIVWIGVDLYKRWLDEDLHKMVLEGKHPKEIIERLADIGKDSVLRFKNSKSESGMRENPLHWPIKVLAADAMYRLGRTIIEQYDDSSFKADILFDKLSIMISDILGACLTNVPHVISNQCFCSAIEEREMSVRNAASLLGETEDILITLEAKVPPLDPEQMAYIDEWRILMNKQKNPSGHPSTSSNNNMSGNNSGEVHVVSIDE